ncbi:uncharacterized protein LOC129777332 [Toxorhynchites rutilus septentrionalis]|uniref:uncharacterized protein LOC129777332 n=1 Tax=Toxorhynchites rutilus septentrionalis TaxID=329112 RepID=UPI002479AF5C|nr:uncharacterized protein LOC129777332 [Toxorhynchites rutilus septentrionalis]
MIIMRALVATVLLISVILLSTVLINANTRNVVSIENERGSRIENEVPQVVESVKTPMVTKKSPEKSVHKGALNPKIEPVEKLDVKVNVEKEGRLIKAIQNTDAKIDNVQTKPSVAKTTVESNDEDIEVNETDIQDELLFTDGFKEKVDVIVHRTTHTLSESPKITERAEMAFTTASKATQKNNPSSSQTTEQQPSMTPLGYEPESYIVLDAEPEIPRKLQQDDDATLVDDIDPVGLGKVNHVLERKQRAVYDGPETYVLNRAPIVPHVGHEHYYGEMPQRCPREFPPPLPAHQPQPTEQARAPPQQAAPQPHSGSPSIYNPYNWDRHHMNLVRFPQCAACQRKEGPVCTTCGRCRECCEQSGCTCGCLRSES